MNTYSSGRSPNDENPRKRSRTACTRCKSRKQKCDSQWPSCSNCLKSNVECDKVALDIEEHTHPDYVRALENRIAVLEIQLNHASRKQADGQAESPLTSDNQHAENALRSNVLRELADFLSVGNLETPAFIGSASGMSLAVNLGEMVQATVWNKALPLSPTASREGGVVTVPLETLRAKTAETPSHEMGMRMIETYFTRIHPRYPFLEHKQVLKLHTDLARLSRIPPVELSPTDKFGLFKLYLVYAIGTVSLQLTDKLSGVSAEGLYMTALQYVSAARETRSNHNIEAMTLLVLYHLRSASSHGLWYMTGLAMRTCIDVGLHRRGNEAGLDIRSIQKRRCLFWSVYSLERVIAISLGRPFSISDKHMDVEFPAEYADTVTGLGHTTNLQVCSNLCLAVALFRLRRIESRIQHSVYRVDRSILSLRPKLAPLHNQLEDWRTSWTDQLSKSELEYLTLHYNRAIRLLVQPFLSILCPSDPLYAMCLRAAGETCQTHKRLHQTQYYGHSFISVQTVFVAGITILYCLWTSTEDIWSVKLSDDLRACSSVLFVMGERASWVKKYRDAFDSLVTATMEKLQGAERGATANVATAQTTNERLGSQDSFSMRMVKDLAGWIGEDNDTLAWMPDFDTLGSLGECAEYFV